MIISFNGEHGSGKSTIAKLVSQKMGYPRYYMGQIFRDIAKERGMTLEDLHNSLVNDDSIDKLVDDYIVKLSEEKKDFVIESRTAWKLIPDSIKIYLKVDSTEAAERIFSELSKENERNEANNLDSIEKIKESIDKRKKMDDERYMKFYGINIREEKNYDLVLDTTQLSIDKVFEKVMAFINKNVNKNV